MRNGRRRQCQRTSTQNASGWSEPPYRGTADLPSTSSEGTTTRLYRAVVLSVRIPLSRHMRPILFGRHASYSPSSWSKTRYLCNCRDEPSVDTAEGSRNWFIGYDCSTCNSHAGCRSGCRRSESNASAIRKRHTPEAEYYTRGTVGPQEAAGSARDGLQMTGRSKRLSRDFSQPRLDGGTAPSGLRMGFCGDGRTVF